MMGKYIIELRGCDDSTEFTMDIADCDLDILIEVAKKSHETSEYRCQPEMFIFDEKRVEVI